MPIDDAPELAEVMEYARRVAANDRAVRDRGEVSADDVVQDVAIQYAALAEPPESWRAWVRHATRNRLIDLARHQARRPRLEELLESRAEHVMGPSAGVIARHQLAEALAVLSQRDRDVLTAHLLGASHDDIARRLGYKSAAVVASTVHRAVGRITAAMPQLRLDLEPQRPY